MKTPPRAPSPPPLGTPPTAGGSDTRAMALNIFSEYMSERALHEKISFSGSGLFTPPLQSVQNSSSHDTSPDDANGRTVGSSKTMAKVNVTPMNRRPINGVRFGIDECKVLKANNQQQSKGQDLLREKNGANRVVLA